jgi:hypothetical protein
MGISYGFFSCSRDGDVPRLIKYIYPCSCQSRDIRIQESLIEYYSWNSLSKEHSGCPLSEIPMGQIWGIYDRPNLYRPLTKYDSLLDLMDRMGPQASRGLVWVVRVTIFPTLWTWENQYVGSNNTLNLHQYRKKPWRINMALQWYNILKVIYIQPIIREKEKSSQAGSLSRPIRRLSMASMK